MPLYIGIVVYGNDPQKQRWLEKLKSRLGAEQLWVVNNHPQKRMPGDQEGDNRFYEFSGYLQLSHLLAGHEGSFLVLNDTLFKTHWTNGWIGLLRQFIQNNRVTGRIIAGDLRYDGNSYAERPHPFLASWIFWMPGREAFASFTSGLESICQLPLPEASPSYKAYLDWWVSPDRRWRGWHGKATSNSRERKKICIRLEHALSRKLAENGLETISLGQFNPFLYRFLRIVDRISTRWHSLTGKS